MDASIWRRHKQLIRISLCFLMLTHIQYSTNTQFHFISFSLVFTIFSIYFLIILLLSFLSHFKFFLLHSFSIFYESLYNFSFYNFIIFVSINSFSHLSFFSTLRQSSKDWRYGGWKKNKRHTHVFVTFFFFAVNLYAYQLKLALSVRM